MTTVTALTRISASAEICFQLSLTLELEIEAMQAYGLRPVAGRTKGIIGPGERVVWEVQQFGLRFQHTTEISKYDPPRSFQDRMVSGLFKSFAHDHSFHQGDSGWTEMRDVMCFSMPWFLGGFVTEHLLVKRRMRHLLRLRNDLIRHRAETNRC